MKLSIEGGVLSYNVGINHGKGVIEIGLGDLFRLIPSFRLEEGDCYIVREDGIYTLYYKHMPVMSDIFISRLVTHFNEYNLPCTTT